MRTSFRCIVCSAGTTEKAREIPNAPLAGGSNYSLADIYTTLKEFTNETLTEVSIAGGLDFKLTEN